MGKDPGALNFCRACLGKMRHDSGIWEPHLDTVRVGFMRTDCRLVDKGCLDFDG